MNQMAVLSWGLHGDGAGGRLEPPMSPWEGEGPTPEDVAVPGPSSSSPDPLGTRKHECCVLVFVPERISATKIIFNMGLTLRPYDW